ncbi:hypothetical protein BS78_02G342200 [Paspalum vaginatum]|nr:hypothetical protein BS78_02G342200 [Paspalum vaginatum]
MTTAPAIEAAKTWSSSILTMQEQNEDVVTEILLRLPSSASVARCRAVCRAWRGITSSPEFVAAYGRRRPLELIVQRSPSDNSVVVDTIPLATLDDVARRRCLHPGAGYPSGGRDWLMGSCDGLLLFEGFYGPETDHLYWVCDPVTRQWATVPPPQRTRARLTRHCGFYLHRPSGEHRILFLSNDTAHDGLPASHYVHSLEAAETRRLGPALAGLHVFAQAMTEYLDYHGKLHWIRHPEVDDTSDILVFDTMDGMLAAMMTTVVLDNRRITHMELWVLEDYSNDKSWTCRHRIRLPPTLFQACWAINYSSTSVIILGDDIITQSSVWLYDLTENRVVNQIQLLTVHHTAFVFKDSLQRHALFDRHKPPIPEPILQSAA